MHMSLLDIGMQDTDAMKCHVGAEGTQFGTEMLYALTPEAPAVV
jgi:hypothetical protein